MALDAVVERFIKGSPVTVMARLGLGLALDARWLARLIGLNLGWCAPWCRAVPNGSPR